MDWIWGAIFLGALSILIAISEIIRKIFSGTIEIPRKIVHITTGICIALTPFFFKTNYAMLVIAGIFTILNFYAIRSGKLKSYNGADRISYGTVYYPLSFFILTLLLWNNYKIILITSILILALADAAAAIVGKSVKKPILYAFGGEQKSVQGSLTMFIFTIVIVFTTYHYLGYLDSNTPTHTNLLWIATITAIMAVTCESISYKGSDNLTVPLGSAFVIHHMLTSPSNNMSFTIGICLAFIIAISSYHFKFLNRSGAVATFILGVIVFGIGGWKFSIPILLFFILSSLISKAGKKQKQKLDATFEKSSQRDMWQVLANGGVAGFAVLFWNYYPHEYWYYIFAGSVAAANADTWATEIGVFSKANPRNILTFNSVPTGSSGGISLLGSSGALLGSIVIALSAYYFIDNFSTLIIIIVAGFLGSVIDSIIGATIQAQYHCNVCDKITEKVIHCNNIPTNLVSGFKSITNDVVNAICTISGAFFIWLLLQLS